MIGLNTSFVMGFDIDSFHITPPIDFMIPVKGPSRYFGEINRNGNAWCKVVIDCTDDSPDFQADISLTELAVNSTNTYSVRPEGYIVLNSSGGNDRFSVKIAGKDMQKVFDNQSLNGTELIAITLVTPGVYLANDIRNSTIQCAIEVTAPTPETVDSIVDPAKVTISENAMSVGNVKLVSGQPLIFEAFKDSHLVIKPKDDAMRIAMADSWKSTEVFLASLNSGQDLPDLA